VESGKGNYHGVTIAGNQQRGSGKNHDCDQGNSFDLVKRAAVKGVKRKGGAGLGRVRNGSCQNLQYQRKGRVLESCNGGRGIGG